MNRYSSITSKYNDHKSKLYFSRIELNRILEFYSFGVSKGNWKDSAIQFNNNESYFHFFKNSSEKPMISISKKKLNKKSKYSFYLLKTNNQLFSHDNIDNLLVYLNRNNIRLISK